MYGLDTNVFRWLIAWSIRDCDGLDEKAHQGSNVENIRKHYANRLIMASISKKYTNGLHHVGGVQKGGNRHKYVE